MDLGPDPGIERGGGGSTTDEPSHARGEDLHRLRDAQARRLPHVPGGNELIDEVADLVPVFVAFEAFLQPVAKLISERRSNVPPLEAAGRSNDAPGETVYAPPQVCLRVVKQLGFDVTPLGFLLSLLCLEPRSIDQALDEQVHVTYRRRRTQVTERAFQIGS